MRCPTCTTQMGKKTGAHQYKECGLDNVWLKDWPMFTCPSCKLDLPLLPNPDIIGPMITSVLVREKARLDGDSIVFLRKSMGLKATELAQVLGVNRVSVSRWENDDQEIDPFYDIKLRLEAIDRILPKHERREAREAVGFVHQCTYTHDLAMGDSPITVPVPCEEAALATA